MSPKKGKLLQGQQEQEGAGKVESDESPAKQECDPNKLFQLTKAHEEQMIMEESDIEVGEKMQNNFGGFQFCWDGASNGWRNSRQRER